MVKTGSISIKNSSIIKTVTSGFESLSQNSKRRIHGPEQHKHTLSLPVKSIDKTTSKKSPFLRDCMAADCALTLPA